jgi:hypothetical protein
MTHWYVGRYCGVEARLGDTHARLLNEGALLGAEGRELHENRAR